MSLNQLLYRFRTDHTLAPNITRWESIPARDARYAPMPALDPRLLTALRARGIEQLYQHQAEAFDLARRGETFVVVTPTASGKTLCYNLPVINQLLENRAARALYIFPTKALSQDQRNEIVSLLEAVDPRLSAEVYDGDTPSSARRAIRARANVVITNPDMLHAGILPHHTQWLSLWTNLRYIVIDEVHHYRGVFGSHFANLLRRLMRIARFYG
jgi:DEAD/DEAH box helicase domain-containing protein